MSCYSCHSELRVDAAYCPNCGARQPDVPECDDYLYSAFISYRHRLRDEEVAQQVQKAIETYVLPKSVAEFYGAPKLPRVFRDADELPATGSLPDSITEALAKSRALIVVCSPDTPDSRWVQREIDYFASIHGRDKIHLVLADGTSSESIPPALLKRLEVGPDGAVEERDTEPLAADFRPDAVKRARQEKLRVIAALVGCSFDDLAQREQTRRRKLAGIAAGILAALLIIGACLLLLASQARNEANLAEVRRCVTASQALYEDADRYGAIEYALKAAETLPPGQDEELEESVKKSLAHALQVDSDKTSIWRPSFAFVPENEIGAFYSFRMSVGHYSNSNDFDWKQSAMTVDEDAEWFALGDAENGVTAYDFRTGRELASFEVNKSSQGVSTSTTMKSIGAANDMLYVNTSAVAPSGEKEDVWICLDPYSGKERWLEVNGIRLTENLGSSDAKLVTMGGITSFANVLAGLASSDSEKAEGSDRQSTVVEGIEEIASDESARQTLDSARGIMGDAEDKYARLKPEDFIYSDQIDYAIRDDVLVVSSVGEFDGTTVPYAIQAFDEDLNELWHYEDTFKSEMMNAESGSSQIIGLPETPGFTTPGGSAVVVVVGRNVTLFDLSSGEKRFERNFDASVVGIFVEDDESLADENHFLCVACADGKVFILNPFVEDDTERSSMEDRFQLRMGSRIRWAEIAANNKQYLRVVAVAIDDEERIVSYNTDFSYGSAPKAGGYTLDELKVMAHEVLKEDGYE